MNFQQKQRAIADDYDYLDLRAESYVPVFIKQVLNSAEGPFQMWGMAFGLVSCTGIVRSIDVSLAEIAYKIEDHTGCIDAYYSLEEDGSQKKKPDVMLNKYVTLHAGVRTEGGRRTLSIFRMRAIKDPNLVTNHMLQVLDARYKSEEYSKNGITGVVGEYDNLSFEIKHKGYDDNSAGLEGLKLDVYKTIKDYRIEEGISRKELMKKFSKTDKAEMNQILEFMISEGYIYSSCDSDHFLIT